MFPEIASVNPTLPSLTVPNTTLPPPCPTIYSSNCQPSGSEHLPHHFHPSLWPASRGELTIHQAPPSSSRIQTPRRFCRVLPMGKMCPNDEMDEYPEAYPVAPSRRQISVRELRQAFYQGIRARETCPGESVRRGERRRVSVAWKKGRHLICIICTYGIYL